MVHNAGKTRKIPIRTRAGETKPSARPRPSPATSVVGATARGASTTDVAPPRSATSDLVRADRLHQRVLIRRRSGIRALATDHVRSRLLQSGGNLGVVGESRPEPGERQHLAGHK